jgi:hypothetical protein
MPLLTFVAVAAIIAAGTATIPSVSLLFLTFGIGCIILSVCLDTL